MEVILYSTHCPRCRVLEKKLQLKNIEYKEENDIEKMTALGIQSVPILQIDGELKNFNEAVQWINQLED